MMRRIIQGIRAILQGPFGWLIVVCGLLLLFLPIGFWIITDAYKHFGEWSFEEVARIPNPSYPIQAVLVQTNGGATTAFGTEVFLTASGQSVNGTEAVASFYDAQWYQIVTGVKLMWESADLLLIEYHTAKSEKLRTSQLEIAGHKIQIKLRSIAGANVQTSKLH